MAILLVTFPHKADDGKTYKSGQTREVPDAKVYQYLRPQAPFGFKIYSLCSDTPVIKPKPRMSAEFTKPHPRQGTVAVELPPPVKPEPEPKPEVKLELPVEEPKPEVKLDEEPKPEGPAAPVEEPKPEEPRSEEHTSELQSH